MPVQRLDASAEFPAPQTIPRGTAGYFDWDEVDDGEAARRGFPRYVYTPHDRTWERESFAFPVEDGVTTAVTTIVPGDLGTALAAALAAVGVRRDAERNRGVLVAVGGRTYRFHTDEASISNYGNTYLLGQDVEAEAGAGSFRTPWRAMGEYVAGGLTLAELRMVSRAAGAFVSGCFARAEAIEAAFKAEATTADLRAAYVLELDAGWPVDAAPAAPGDGGSPDTSTDTPVP